MSAPENPLFIFGIEVSSTLMIGSLMASDPAREASRGQDILWIERTLHAPHQFKIGARRAPHHVRRRFYFRRAPLENRRQPQFRLGTDAEYVRHRGSQFFRRCPVFSRGQKRGLDDSGGPYESHEIEFVMKGH